MVMSFIDSHREELGIEPICRELAVAPSSYHEHAARLADPAKRSARARRDDEIKQQISQVHAASSGLYGTRKVWHQMRREGSKVAKCMRISEVLDTHFAKSRTSVSLSPGQFAQIGQECLVEFQAAMISAFSPWVKRDGARVLRMLSPSRAMR
jgi:hypothetical protein